MHIVLYIFMYIQLYTTAIKKGYRKNNLYRLVFFLYPSGFYNGIKIYNVNISEKNKKVNNFLPEKLKNINDIIVFFII